MKFRIHFCTEPSKFTSYSIRYCCFFLFSTRRKNLLQTFSFTPWTMRYVSFFLSLCVCVFVPNSSGYFFLCSFVCFFFCVKHAHTYTLSLGFHSEINVERTKKNPKQNKFIFSCFTHKQHTMYTLHEPNRLQSNSRMLHTSESEMVNGKPNSTDPM